MIFCYTITLSEEEILSSDVTQSMVIMKGACPPVKYGKHAICQLEKYLECTDLNACFILPRTCIFFIIMLLVIIGIQRGVYVLYEKLRPQFRFQVSIQLGEISKQISQH